MANTHLNIEQLRNCLKEFKLEELFVDGLGWNRPQNNNKSSVTVNNKTLAYFPLAEMGGAKVLKFKGVHPSEMVSETDRKKLHKQIKKDHNKHLLIFSDDKSCCSWSYLSKNESLRTHDFHKEQNGDLFISKIANIHFSIEDEPQIAEIGEKLERAFDTEKVTKRFYEDFKTNHFSFQKYIIGIKRDEDKAWYSSVILNRLMFVWFLQKKGFVDNNVNYLQDKLREYKKKDGGLFYSSFLKLLFFEGFAKKVQERSPIAKKSLGRIKYLNGGLFVPHIIEERYGEKIKIKDKAFEETFKVFSKYEWHLRDDMGKDNEISSDVLGYIFEKYITDIQQKSMGAYYTRDEITTYLSKNTIHKRILEKINKQGYSFNSLEEMSYKLDAKLCKVLLTNEDSVLNTLTILDPAVGSGAFLLSAMKELGDIYAPIIGKIETSSDRELKKWYGEFKIQHKSPFYGIKRNIILKNLYGVDIMKEATEVCKLRLFLSLVSSAIDIQELEPLPNMDFNIMHGNSLIGFLKETGEENEQFSLFGDTYSQKIDEYNRLVKQYKVKTLSFEKLRELKSKIYEFLKENNSKLNKLLANKCNRAGLKYSEIIDIKGKKKNDVRKRPVLPEDFHSEDISKNSSPFHWDFSFNEIIGRGGFDVIITNPPWNKINLEEKEFFKQGASNIISSVVPKELETFKIKSILLNDPVVHKKYYKYLNFYSFQRHYFLKFYWTEINNTNETSRSKKSSAHMDIYRLFLERCFNLLDKNGFAGLVIPSGLCRDDGSIGLRKLLFKKTKISGLIDFQNQMDKGKGKVFEGVDSRFKFLILTLSKGKPVDQFPCQFQERNLSVLDDFPENPKMTQSIREIKEFSPKDFSIIEFKNPKDKRLFKKANEFPEIGEELKNLWNPYIYTEELNETRSAYLFSRYKRSKNFLSVYKGDNIYQYNYKLSNKNRYLYKNNEVILNSLKPCLKNKYYKNYRLVIRTIASNTNERSLISAVIPKNHFISNSLHGVHINSNQSPKNNKYMLLLQAFLNSFAVDYFIRQKVSVNINKKYITPLKIPRLTEKDPYFKELVEGSARLTCISNEFNELADEIGIKRGGIKDEQERLKVQGEIDAIVAYVYGFSFGEFEYILNTFRTGKNQDRLNALKKYALEAYRKDHFLDKAS